METILKKLRESDIHDLIAEIQENDYGFQEIDNVVVELETALSNFEVTLQKML